MSGHLKMPGKDSAQIYRQIVTHAVLNGLAATSIKQRHLTVRTRAWLKLREEDGCANARLVLLEGQKELPDLYYLRCGQQMPCSIALRF